MLPTRLFATGDVTHAFRVRPTVANLQEQSRPVADNKEISQVVAISANNDPTIGTIIAKAMEQVGKDGVITVE